MEIVKAIIAMSSKKSTLLIGEDTDVLILLLYLGEFGSMELFFRSDKGNSHMYNIKTLKAFLGNDVCTGLLFATLFWSYKVVPIFSVLHAKIKCSRKCWV